MTIGPKLQRSSHWEKNNPLKQTRGFAPTRRCISHYEEMS